MSRRSTRVSFLEEKTLNGSVRGHSGNRERESGKKEGGAENEGKSRVSENDRSQSVPHSVPRTV